MRARARANRHADLFRGHDGWSAPHDLLAHPLRIPSPSKYIASCTIQPIPSAFILRSVPGEA
jgi:hypothetical protein